MATPAAVNKPTVVPVDHFDAAEDCRRLHKAMAGLGTNEKAIIEILAHRSAEQRQILISTYETNFHKSLVKTLQKELRGDFEKLVLACMELPAAMDARRLEKATKGLGTKENLLVDVICSKDNFQMDKLKAAYQLIFERSAIENVKKDTSREFQKVLLTLLRCERDDSDKVDEEEAKVEADALYRAGEGHRGTKANVFTEILTKRNYRQLRAIFRNYEEIAGHGLDHAIKKKTSGDLQKAYMTIFSVANDVHAYYAEKIRNAMKGMGTKEASLIQNIVSRLEIAWPSVGRRFIRNLGRLQANCGFVFTVGDLMLHIYDRGRTNAMRRVQIDMGNIKVKFEEMYGRSMEEEISRETGGYFKTMLLALIS